MFLNLITFFLALFLTAEAKPAPSKGQYDNIYSKGISRDIKNYYPNLYYDYGVFTVKGFVFTPEKRGLVIQPRPDVPADIVPIKGSAYDMLKKMTNIDPEQEGRFTHNLLIQPSRYSSSSYTSKLTIGRDILGEYRLRHRVLYFNMFKDHTSNRFLFTTIPEGEHKVDFFKKELPTLLCEASTLRFYDESGVKAVDMITNTFSSKDRSAFIGFRIYYDRKVKFRVRNHALQPSKKTRVIEYEPPKLMEFPVFGRKFGDEREVKLELIERDNNPSLQQITSHFQSDWIDPVGLCPNAKGVLTLKVIFAMVENLCIPVANKGDVVLTTAEDGVATIYFQENTSFRKGA